MPFSTDYPEPCSPNGSFGEVASLVLNLLVVVSNYEGGYVMASRYDQRFLLPKAQAWIPYTASNSK